MTQYFKYELTAFPTSLFKDACMHIRLKSQLAKAITTGVEPTDCSVSAVYVIDSGALLHKTKWANNASYKYIVKQYVSMCEHNMDKTVLSFLMAMKMNLQLKIKSI